MDPTITSEALLAELARLVAFPTYRNPKPFLDYLVQRLPFLPWTWQPVDPARGVY